MMTRFASAVFLIDSVVIGLGGLGHSQVPHLVDRTGDPFMVFFVELGAVLLVSGYAMGPATAPAGSRSSSGAR